MTISDKKTYEKGLQIRTDVLGSEYVKPNIDKGKEDPFHGAIQDVVTEYCWGMGWGREGVLNKKQRSMLTIAILTALGKPAELKAHTRGALRNGVSVEEIKEVLIHATVYCGIPAGVDAFRNAKEAIDLWEDKKT
ncbi:MAG: gamma carboxymuconolactone decarboxylase [Rhodospirillaceae bacterium]|nr:gamma carboxymuconolactone decarboxylase [Rhodospirillaceae bacterium]|tara:strand:- start:4938 stop:5342 length:405 start_codon:yes stop_codon:yes gene_type:complete